MASTKTTVDSYITGETLQPATLNPKPLDQATRFVKLKKQKYIPQQKSTKPKMRHGQY